MLRFLKDTKGTSLMCSELLVFVRIRRVVGNTIPLNSLSIFSDLDGKLEFDQSYMYFTLILSQ